jgi:hypothetical protein
MQGTVMMLMALSGLGCHNKGYDMVYAPPTYSGYPSGCYANAYPNFVSPQSDAGCYVGGYSGCYAAVYGGGCFGGGCYGGGLSSCYSACYGGRHHGCGLLSRLFSCCKSRGHGCYSYGYGYGGDPWGYDDTTFYGGPAAWDLPYSPSVNGYARAFNYGVGAPGEAEMGYYGGMQGAATPSEAVPPVPATPATANPPTPSATTPPTPGPVTPPAPASDLTTPPAAPKPAAPDPAPPKPTT